MKDNFKTILSFNEAELKEKGSVFTGHAYPVQRENEAHEILSTIKKKYYDASHHCFAYKLLDSSFKYSDAGEPNGTAGIRILNAIEHFELHNILVVVIRYFGGTKLGIGPLGKAYYQAAFNAINSANIIAKTAYEKIIIEIDFSLISHIHRILSSFDAKIDSADYTEKAYFNCYIKPADKDKIKLQLIDAASGNVIFSETGELSYFG